MMKQSEPRLTWETRILELSHPFHIAHGRSDTRIATWIRLEDDSGWGEGTIPPYYGISQEEMEAWWATAAQRRDPFPDDPAEIAAWVGDSGPAPARAALDLALHDRLGRQRGQPLYELLGLPRPETRPTAFTIAIDTPDEMARQAQAAPYPVIKIKLGSDDDVTRVAAIRRARPDATLYIDANAAWGAAEAIAHIQRMAVYDLALVEQPVAKDNIEGMGEVQAQVTVPVVADESLQSLADVERLAAVGVQGINLKLMKVGGISPGLAILYRARQLGLRVMLGCMVETSLGVTAMAHLAGLADWLDLDAPLLIRNDPFSGLRYDEQARLHLPPRPGIGVTIADL
jgi:L-alanine-DL-glutamate epimerase-like enolase superfamily enzyme